MKKFLIAATAAAVLLFFSCASFSETQCYAMSTYLSQELYGEKAESAAKANEELILAVENELSATLPASSVYLLNEQGRGELSGYLWDIMDDAVYYEGYTSGAFCPYMREIVELWDIGGENENIPSEKDTLAAVKRIRENETVFNGSFLELSGKKLDLGGIAKGYALDKLSENARSFGIKSGLIDLGGSIAAIGEKSSGDAWTVGIKDPFDGTSVIASARLKDAFISTSGVYERYFIENEKRYHHIFDPETGRPAEGGLASVSVIADSGIRTDALSTALFVMGSNDGVDFAEKNGVAAVFVCDDGEIIVTEEAERYSVEIF